MLNAVEPTQKDFVICPATVQQYDTKQCPSKKIENKARDSFNHHKNNNNSSKQSNKLH